MERQISVEDWKKMDPEQTVLVDVREEAQTQFGTIEGALYIPATSLWISPRAKLNIKHENPGCFLSSRVSMFYINGHHGRHHHHNLSRPD